MVFIKQNFVFGKQNFVFGKQNFVFIKQNFVFIKQSLVFIKQNFGFIKQSSLTLVPKLILLYYENRIVAEYRLEIGFFIYIHSSRHTDSRKLFFNWDILYF